MLNSGSENISCNRAVVFDIQDFSVQDGPGIRTTIFFKGCPLKCKWCSNPEGENIYPELFYFSSLCKKSHRCINSCPYNAVELKANGYPVFNRDVCKDCKTKDCVNTCYSDALRLAGYYITIDKIIEKIKPNIPFYRNSNGGLTLSGGEPFLQHTFVKNLLHKCNETGISVCAETCGYFSWDDVSDFIDNFELIYFDIKSLNDELHKNTTGRSNKLILTNLAKLTVNNRDKVVVCIPIVPGVNDSVVELKKITEYCKDLSVKKIRLLPYHSYGREKYTALGKSYDFEEVNEITADVLNTFKNTISSSGIDCWIE